MFQTNGTVQKKPEGGACALGLERLFLIHKKSKMSRPQRCHGTHITRGTPEEGSEENDQDRSELP